MIPNASRFSPRLPYRQPQRHLHRPAYQSRFDSPHIQTVKLRSISEDAKPPQLHSIASAAIDDQRDNCFFTCQDQRKKASSASNPGYLQPSRTVPLDGTSVAYSESSRTKLLIAADGWEAVGTSITKKPVLHWCNLFFNLHTQFHALSPIFTMADSS